MKDSKTILTRHIVLSLTLQAVAVVLIALPTLDPYRARFTELTSLPASSLWIPLLGLALIANYFILRRISAYLVAPAEELVNQTKLGATAFAFKKKSMNAEEDHLKHFIESLSIRAAELEQEIIRMESEVERVNEVAQTSPEEIDGLRQKVENAEQKAVDSTKLLANEQERSTRLEKELSAAKRELKQALRELETLQEETENGKPLSATPEVIHSNEPTSLLVERLRNPLNLINNLSWRLARSWADTPPSQVRDGLEEICKQSEEQLELLKKYRASASSEEDRERDAL